MSKNWILLLFSLSLFYGCRNEKTEFDYDSEKVKIHAYQEAPLGGFGFVLLKDNRFRINRHGLFHAEYYFGEVNTKLDTIHLAYYDKINFDSIPLPKKLKIEGNRLKTDLRNWKYYFNISKKTKD